MNPNNIRIRIWSQKHYSLTSDNDLVQRETFVLFKLSSDISSYIQVSTQTEEEYKEWARNRQEVAQSQIFKKLS